LDILMIFIMLPFVLERAWQHFQTDRMGIVMAELVDIIPAIFTFPVLSPGHQNTQGLEGVGSLGYAVPQTLRRGFQSTRP
jgi:hypothetical protein